MLGFVALAVASLTLPAKPEPKGNHSGWVQAADLPEIDNRSATTTFDLTLDPSGQAIHCAVIVASGSVQLDRAVCVALLKRARFKPAVDAAGLPIASVFRDRVVWRPEASGPNYWFKGADILVSTPIIERRSKKLAEILLTVSETGLIENCSVTKSVGNPSLDELACSVAKRENLLPAITDAQGTPVRGIRSLYVGFMPSSIADVQIM